MNQVILIGRLNHKEVSYTARGTAIAKFSITIEEKGERKTIKLSSYGDSAAIVGDALTGTTLVCRGKIDSRKYISKKDGKEAEFQDVSIFQVIDAKDSFPTQAPNIGTFNSNDDIAF